MSQSEESERFHFLPILTPSFTYMYLVKTRLSERKTEAEEQTNHTGAESIMYIIGLFCSSDFAPDSNNLVFIRS